MSKETFELGELAEYTVTGCSWTEIIITETELNEIERGYGFFRYRKKPK